MTTSRDGKAIPKGYNPMSDHIEATTEAQTAEDTAEAQSRKFDQLVEEMREAGEGFDPLPLEEDAELGELHRSQDGEETAEEYYEEVGAIYDGPFKADGWNLLASGISGWGYKTPVGVIPMPPMEPNEVLDFVEELEKPWPAEDPRRESQ
jgi:hypothetical protein